MGWIAACRLALALNRNLLPLAMQKNRGEKKIIILLKQETKYYIYLFLSFMASHVTHILSLFFTYHTRTSSPFYINIYTLLHSLFFLTSAHLSHTHGCHTLTLPLALFTSQHTTHGFISKPSHYTPSQTTHIYIYIYI